MSVRRWIGVGGLTVAIAGGTAGAVRGVAETQYEAEAALRLRGPTPVGLPVPFLSDPERLLDEPAIRELVHLRLGEAPPVRVKPIARDTVLVRSRGATAQMAAEASRTYAASYVDVRRRQADAELDRAAATLQGRISQLESRVDTGVGSERAATTEQIGYLAQRLEELRAQRQSPNQGPAVVAVTPAVPVDDGARRAWILAALGGAVALGAAATARRYGADSPGTAAPAP